MGLVGAGAEEGSKVFQDVTEGGISSAQFCSCE